MNWIDFTFLSLFRWLSASSSHLDDSFFRLLMNILLFMNLFNYFLLVMNLISFLVSILISCDWLSSIRRSLNSITSSDYFWLTLIHLTILISWLNLILYRSIRLISFWNVLWIIVIWISSWFISSNFNSSSLLISLIRNYIR